MKDKSVKQIVTLKNDVTENQFNAITKMSGSYRSSGKAITTTEI